MDYSENHREAEKVVRKIGSRNPYDAADWLNAHIRVSDRFGPTGLKGFCTVCLKNKYIVINGNLNEADQRLVCAHEVGHLVRDSKEMGVFTFQENFLCDRSSLTERNANFFAADFLISDENMLDVLYSGEGDFFKTARELCVPSDFLLFKLSSMVRRGYELRLPKEIDSHFLAKPL